MDTGARRRRRVGTVVEPRVFGAHMQVAHQDTLAVCTRKLWRGLRPQRYHPMRLVVDKDVCFDECGHVGNGNVGRNAAMRGLEAECAASPSLRDATLKDDFRIVGRTVGIANVWATHDAPSRCTFRTPAFGIDGTTNGEKSRSCFCHVDK